MPTKAPDKKFDKIKLLKDTLGGKHAGGSDWTWQGPDVDALRRVRSQVHRGMHRWRGTCPPGQGRDRVLDANAAYVAAAGSVRLARRTPTWRGKIPFDRKLGGFWQVKYHRWDDPRIGHPLGAVRVERLERGGWLWLTTDSVVLLEQLHRAGHWPEIEVRNSYVSEAGEHDLQGWQAAMREELAKPDADRAHLKSMAYGLQAFELINPDLKTPFDRPDWYAALIARSAARIWWDAWRAVQAGAIVTGIEATDAITVHCDSPDHRPAWFCDIDKRMGHPRVHPSALYCYKPRRDPQTRADTSWIECSRG